LPSTLIFKFFIAFGKFSNSELIVVNRIDYCHRYPFKMSMHFPSEYNHGMHNVVFGLRNNNICKGGPTDCKGDRKLLLPTEVIVIIKW
jgi:hypothetical protein